MVNAAFFDIDGTLLKENTSIIFIRSMYKDKKIGLGILFKVIWLNLKYKMNILSLEDMEEFGLGFIKDFKKDELTEYSKLIFNQKLKPLILKPMIEEIESKKKEGLMIVLLTNAPDLIADEFKKNLGIDNSISSKVGFKDKIATGRFEKLCFEENKYKFFKEISDEKKIDLNNSYFYTDSYSDIDVLNAVGHPIAVNPSKKLKKISLKKGWKIITPQNE